MTDKTEGLLKEIERLHQKMASLVNGSLIVWILQRVVVGDHGCLTGDCLHQRQHECVDAVWKSFCEDNTTTQHSPDGK